MYTIIYYYTLFTYIHTLHIYLLVGVFFVGPTRVESMVFFLLLHLAGYLFFADGFIPSFWAARSFRCASSTDAIKAEDTPLQVKAADLLISAMFKIKPLKKYRSPTWMAVAFLTLKCSRAASAEAEECTMVMVKDPVLSRC